MPRREREAKFPATPHATKRLAYAKIWRGKVWEPGMEGELPEDFPVGPWLTTGGLYAEVDTSETPVVPPEPQGQSQEQSQEQSREDEP